MGKTFIDLLRSKPYLICWLGILVLLMTGLLLSSFTVSFQIYDTYYLLGTSYFVLAGSLWLLLLGGGYWLVSWRGKKLNALLTALHLLLTTGVLAYVSFSFAQNYDYDLAPSTVLLVSLFTFVSAQFIYLINILIAFLRK